MESELLKREKFHQLVLANIPSFVFWKNKASIYMGCNNNFAESAGFELPTDIIGKTDYDLPWSKKESDFFRKIDKEVMDSGKAQINFEESQTIQDGSTRWLRTSKIPLLDDNDEVIGILGTYEDITERKLMEFELISNNESLKTLNSRLEMINVDLEQFAYSTSHDLQEPLRMIGGFVGLFSMKYENMLDDEANIYVKYIKDGVLRMSTLIRQILSYSKLDKIEEQFVETDFKILLKELLDGLGLSSNSTPIKFDINVPKQKIVCQPERIKMLFYNLIKNGIKFNEASKPIIKINYKNREKEWYFEVADNGIGIKKEFTDEIFKPFKRLHSQDKYTGSGIGLSICKRIIYLHGGEIYFTKNKMNGTTFHFTLSKTIPNHES